MSVILTLLPNSLDSIRIKVLKWHYLDLVPNRWNQTLCLVPSPSIKKRGESVGWLPEEGKDGITTSMSLPEQPDCTCVHMQKILINVTNLIKQFIWTVFLLL